MQKLHVNKVYTFCKCMNIGMTHTVGNCRKSDLKTIVLSSVLTQHQGGQQPACKFNLGVINFLKGSITSLGHDLRATCTSYI